MKFLKAVRLDDSDDRLLATTGGAATDGEWAVSGGYGACELAQGHRAPGCRCDSTFMAAGTQRRCTLAEVCEIDEPTYQRLKQALALHFLKDLGAPDDERALAAAEDECAYTAELAEGFPAEVWITVQREPSEDGVREHYTVFKRLMIGSHKL
jgi:hypothetical protein